MVLSCLLLLMKYFCFVIWLIFLSVMKNVLFVNFFVIFLKLNYFMGRFVVEFNLDDISC